MTDERDPPIESPGFVYGLTVVDIGDVRVARGLSRRAHSSCPHHRMMYDNAERRIWCRDCERDVEPFDAFKNLIEGYDNVLKAVERREEAVKQAETFQVRSRAAKVMDEAWRRQKMVPACPHCKRGIFPADVVNGVAMMGKDYAERLAKSNPGRT